jgi:DNA repair protein RadD
MTELRPYQQRVIDRVGAEIAVGRRRLLLVAPTGSGKSVIAAAVVADAVGCQKRVLFLSHRRELIQQTSAKLHAAGVDHGVIQAGFPTRPGEGVQVASISTLHARAVRTNKMELPAADLFVIDEAHHCRARTYRRLIEAYPSAIILGLTATPCRGDGRGLGNMFETIVECPPVAELIAGGFLCPPAFMRPGGRTCASRESSTNFTRPAPGSGADDLSRMFRRPTRGAAMRRMRMETAAQGGAHRDCRR